MTLSDDAKALIAALVADTSLLDFDPDHACAPIGVWNEIREVFPVRLVNDALRSGALTVQGESEAYWERELLPVAREIQEPCK